MNEIIGFLFSSVFYFAGYNSSFNEDILKDRVFFSVFNILEEIEEKKKFFAQDILRISGKWKVSKKKDINSFVTNDNIVIKLWVINEKSSDYSWHTKNFKRYFSNVTFDIRSFSEKDVYFRALKDAFRTGDFPDVFIINEVWIKDFSEDIIASPSELFSKKECLNFFFNFSCEVFSDGNKILGLPYSINPLIMVYNKSLMSDDMVFVGNRVHEDWNGFIKNFTDFSRINKNSDIKFAGIGSNLNGDNLLKFFYSLLIQSDNQLSIKNIEEIILMIDKVFTVGKNIISDFLQGKVIILFGDYYDFLKIRSKLADKAVDVKIKEDDVVITNVPYLSEDLGGFARTSGFVVAKKSINKATAWAFLVFMMEDNSIINWQRKTNKIPSKVNLVYDNDIRAILNNISPLKKNIGYDFEKDFNKKFDNISILKKEYKDYSVDIYKFLFEND